MNEPREPEIGVAPSRPLKLVDRDAIRDRIASIAESARRDLVVFAPQMDAHFFNGASFSQALRAFAISQRYNRARLLVEDAEQTLRDNDRLIGLCRRLSESLQLRQVGEEHVGLREMFIVADRASYLYQPDVTAPECVVEPAGRKNAVKLIQRFEIMWDRSEPLPGFQTAGLVS